MVPNFSSLSRLLEWLFRFRRRLIATAHYFFIRRHDNAPSQRYCAWADPDGCGSELGDAVVNGGLPRICVPAPSPAWPKPHRIPQAQVVAWNKDIALSHHWPAGGAEGNEVFLASVERDHLCARTPVPVRSLHACCDNIRPSWQIVEVKISRIGRGGCRARVLADILSLSLNGLSRPQAGQSCPPWVWRSASVIILALQVSGMNPWIWPGLATSSYEASGAGAESSYAHTGT